MPYGAPPPQQQHQQQDQLRSAAANADFYGSDGVQANVGDGRAPYTGDYAAKHQVGHSEYAQDFDPANGGEGERGLGTVALGTAGGFFAAKKMGVHGFKGALMAVGTGIVANKVRDHMKKK